MIRLMLMILVAVTFWGASAAVVLAPERFIRRNATAAGLLLLLMTAMVIATGFVIAPWKACP